MGHFWLLLLLCPFITSIHYRSLHMIQHALFSMEPKPTMEQRKKKGERGERERERERERGERERVREER